MRSVRAPRCRHARAARDSAAEAARRYGPRESTRAESFSDEGRLHVDAKLCTFARPHLRGAFGQARPLASASQTLPALTLP